MNAKSFDKKDLVSRCENIVEFFKRNCYENNQFSVNVKLLGVKSAFINEEEIEELLKGKSEDFINFLELDLGELWEFFLYDNQEELASTIDAYSNEGNLDREKLDNFSYVCSIISSYGFYGRSGGHFCFSIKEEFYENIISDYIEPFLNEEIDDLNSEFISSLEKKLAFLEALEIKINDFVAEVNRRKQDLNFTEWFKFWLECKVDEYESLGGVSLKYDSDFKLTVNNPSGLRFTLSSEEGVCVV